MQSFEKWCKKYQDEDTPRGDVARYVRVTKSVPYFHKKSQVIDFIRISWTNASAINTFEEMYDIYEQEVIIPAHGGLSEEDWLKCHIDKRMTYWRNRNL